MPPPDPAGGLAARQAELVLALTGQAQVPAGFEPGRLEAAAAALARKRLRAAARAWPALAEALGPAFGEHFRAYAGLVPLPELGGPLADGRAFARFLARRGLLPDPGRLEALHVDLDYAPHPRGLVRRRRPAFCCAWLRSRRRLIVGLYLPRLGKRCFRLPW